MGSMLHARVSLLSSRRVPLGIHATKDPVCNAVCRLHISRSLQLGDEATTLFPVATNAAFRLPSRLRPMPLLSVPVPTHGETSSPEYELDRAAPLAVVRRSGGPATRRCGSARPAHGNAHSCAMHAIRRGQRRAVECAMATRVRRRSCRGAIRRGRSRFHVPLTPRGTAPACRAVCGA
jgi:hypothetical protein